ncbi:nucleotidyl transferase AbiEii/AbiGii toxin family protein [Rheinheimera metallidurans]|uniref:nucleotidyl transferase AbiEii/AbiGii toxin family protein n=1 Tax=Rheinheimera metallidurans TaxID=2925781 RepID=UPI003001E2CC
MKNFNSDYLKQHNILFGGGTRIALEINEYRESVDIDFLCGDKAAFRAVRQQVTSNSLGNLVNTPFSYARDIRCQ